MDHVVDDHPGPPGGEPSGVQVDVGPAEPGQFGPSHPGGGDQQPQGIQTIEVILLRFFQDLDQYQIAARVGFSQMHVSRLQRRALARMRAQLIEP